jgi:nucleotide-binding universal stress UspA family protein
MEPTVVCAFDPDAADRSALELARICAGVLDARLLVAVVRPGGTAPERLARLEPGSHRTLRAPRDATVLEVAAPSPSAGLHHVLATERPALAVAGSAERAPIGRVLLGTTTERLLDGAPCPLAIAPRGWRARPLSAIAVAVLPSAEGRAALSAAASLARAARVPLRVVMVLSDSPDDAQADELAHALAGVAGDGSTARVDRVAPPDDDGRPGRFTPAHGVAPLAPLRALPPRHGGAAAVLAPTLEAIAGPPLELESEVYVGDPADTLVRASARADLLVLGSRAYGAADAVHAGGVARHVLTRALCPVVLVPREAAGD